MYNSILERILKFQHKGWINLSVGHPAGKDKIKSGVGFPGFTQIIDIGELCFSFKNPVTNDHSGCCTFDVLLNIIDSPIMPVQD